MKPTALAMHPSGTLGRGFGVLMEWINTPSYRTALRTLAAGPDERVLEIGFGTGKFAELLLASNTSVQLAGIDPTATMVSVARSRRTVRAAESRAELREGDASALPWSDDSFHAVVAIHSFQFWRDPRQSLRDISRVLMPSGRILLILRNHARRRAVEWLPNPLSRSSIEVPETVFLLEQSGFLVRRHPDTGNSHVLSAIRKT